jgi:hypothetical protein
MSNHPEAIRKIRDDLRDEYKKIIDDEVTKIIKCIDACEEDTKKSKEGQLYYARIRKKALPVVSKIWNVISVEKDETYDYGCIVKYYIKPKHKNE